MMIPSTFRRSLMLTALVAVFTATTAVAAHAETDYYRDARMPNGHARSVAAKRADFRACGGVNGKVSKEDFPRANACMEAHGWVVDHVVYDRADRRAPAQQQKTWQRTDDDGTLLTCHAMFGDFGEVCTNF
jgi:hypothetical protein